MLKKKTLSRAVSICITYVQCNFPSITKIFLILLGKGDL